MSPITDDAGTLRRQHGPVRRGMRQRHTGRQHQCGEVGPRDFAQIGGGEAGFCGQGEAVGIVVAGDDVRAAGLQRMTARKARPAEAEHRNRLAGEARDGNHLTHRSFSVDNPASASMTEMIQKRMTTCGSVQPFCSK